MGGACGRTTKNPGGLIPRFSVTGAPLGAIDSIPQISEHVHGFHPHHDAYTAQCEIHELVPDQRLHNLAIFWLWLRMAASVSAVSRRDALMTVAVVQKERMASGGLPLGWQIIMSKPKQIVFNPSTPYAVPNHAALVQDSCQQSRLQFL